MLMLGVGRCAPKCWKNVDHFGQNFSAVTAKKRGVRQRSGALSDGFWPDFSDFSKDSPDFRLARRSKTLNGQSGGRRLGVEAGAT